MPLHIINPFTCWKSQNSPHISREPALFFHQFCQRARQDASDKKQKRKIKNTKMQFVQKNFLGNLQRKNISNPSIKFEHDSWFNDYSVNSNTRHSKSGYKKGSRDWPDHSNSCPLLSCHVKSTPFCNRRHLNDFQ